MHFTAEATIVAVIASALVGFTRQGQDGDSLQDTTAILADVTLDGGEEVQRVLRHTPNSGTAPEFQGNLRSPHRVKDLTVQVVRHGSTETGPEPSMTANAPAVSVESANGATTNVTNANLSDLTHTSGTPPTTTHIGFEAKLPCLAAEITANLGAVLKINIESSPIATAHRWEVRVMPSMVANQVHCDLLENIVVKGAVKSGNRSTNLIGNEDLITHVENLNSDVSIISFKGKCNFSGDGASLSRVLLVDPESGYASVSGATVVTNGSSYTVAGFSLAPGKTYALIFTSPVEADSMSVKVEAITE